MQIRRNHWKIDCVQKNFECNRSLSQNICWNSPASKKWYDTFIASKKEYQLFTIYLFKTMLRVTKHFHCIKIWTWKKYKKYDEINLKKPMIKHSLRIMILEKNFLKLRLYRARLVLWNLKSDSIKCRMIGNLRDTFVCARIVHKTKVLPSILRRAAFFLICFENGLMQFFILFLFKS